MTNVNKVQKDSNNNMDKIFSTEKAFLNQLLAKEKYYNNSNRDKFWTYINDAVIEKIKDVKKDFKKILIISFASDNNEKLEQSLKSIFNKSDESNCKENIVIEISSMSPEAIKENKSLSGDFDLIISLMNLHKINDPMEFLLKIYSLLQEDGFFIDCFIGGESLIQLREYLMRKEIEITNGAQQRIHPMIRPDSMSNLLQNSPFKLSIVDHEIITVKCNSFKKLSQNIRSIGEQSCLNDSKIINKKVLSSIKADCESGVFPTTHTIDIVFSSGWK